MREEIIQLTTEAIRAGEMRQGCTNHSYYAEKITDQILSYQRKEIEKVENPSKGKEHDYEGGHAWFYDGFENCRHKILSLLKEEK